jgi:opacity protein-like surface antigen
MQRRRVLRGDFIIFGAGLAGLVSVSAIAADLPSPAPTPAMFSPAAATDWRGLYAGSFIGLQQGRFSTSQATSANGAALGFSSGVLVGYNWQSGAIVYGLEGDIAANSAQKKFGGQPGLIANEVDNLYALHARARLGYDFGTLLPFIAGGAAFGRTEQFRQAPFDSDGDTQNSFGWTLGAGVDVKVVLPFLGPSILRGEYLYESYAPTVFDLNGPRLRTQVGNQTVRGALISRGGDDWRPPAGDGVDWSGDYVGVLAGGAWDWVSTSGMGQTTRFSSSGPTGGLYSGHNWMFGDTMLGVEGVTMLANIMGRGAQPDAPMTSYRAFVDTDFRGRAGYSFGRFMPYMAAGVAYGQSQQINLVTGDERGLTPSWAWTVGVGLDYMLTERLVLRAEYLYAHTFSSQQTDLDNDGCCAQSRTGDSLRLGLAYYFH